MSTEEYNDECSMEIDASDDAFTYDDQKAATTTSIDPIYQAISFSLDNQRELPVSLSQAAQLEDFISDQSMIDSDDDDDDDMGDSESSAYIPHASYHSNSSNIRYPEFRSEFEEDVWSPTYNKTGHFFVRKQSRNDPQRRDVSENDIALHDLTGQSVHVEKQIWYNATSTESAIKKVEEGPQMSSGPLDMAYYGAFYLNSDYRDARDWHYTKDSQFQGKHAILVYKFRPEMLSKKGKEVLDIKKWRSLAGERSQRSGKFEDDWTYTYQSSNPKEIHKSGDNAKIRKRWDNQPAMQLIIYTKEMCRKIHPFLIGCIYFEKCNIPVDALVLSSQILHDQQSESDVNSSASSRLQSQSSQHRSKLYRTKHRK